MSPGPAFIGTCPRQKATNPDTGVAPPYPYLPGGAASEGVRAPGRAPPGRCQAGERPGRLEAQSVIRKARMFESSPVHLTGQNQEPL